jgi:hypothetical protein
MHGVAQLACGRRCFPKRQAWGDRGGPPSQSQWVKNSDYTKDISRSHLYFGRFFASSVAAAAAHKDPQDPVTPYKGNRLLQSAN